MVSDELDKILKLAREEAYWRGRDDERAYTRELIQHFRGQKSEAEHVPDKQVDVRDLTTYRWVN